MIGWLWRMVIGRFTTCHHRWMVRESITGNYVIGNGTRRFYVLRCEKCGDMKNHDVC
jgi:hypothetical protein